MLAYMPQSWFVDADGDKFKKTNIFYRVAMADAIKNDQRAYLPYRIKLGETARDLSQRYYEDSEYFWVIYLMNDMVDIYNDWPKGTDDLKTFVEDKYGSENVSAIHHYETPNGQPRDLRAMRDIYEFDVSIKDSEIVNAFALTPVTNYQYEERLNNDKRSIKVLRKDYLDSLVDAVEEEING